MNKFRLSPDVEDALRDVAQNICRGANHTTDPSEVSIDFGSEDILAALTKLVDARSDKLYRVERFDGRVFKTDRERAMLWFLRIENKSRQQRPFCLDAETRTLHFDV